MAVHRATFLDAIRAGATVTRAAERAGVNRRQHSRWLEDSAYAEEFADALHQAGDRYDEEMDRRAIEGLVRFKFDRNGNPIVHPVTQEPYYEREYSDALLMFRAKAVRPEVYKERHELTGAKGGPVQVQHSTIDPLQFLTDEEYADVKAKIELGQQRALLAKKDSDK
jgi:hypothetical protein